MLVCSIIIVPAISSFVIICIILSSIFPEKLIFQGKYRTPRINEVLSILLTVDKASGESEKKRPAKISRSSLLVNLRGLKSNQFLEDLKRIDVLRGILK